MKFCFDNRSILANAEHILPAVDAVMDTLIECRYYDIGNTDYLPDVGLSSSDEEPPLNISSSSS